MNQAAPQPGGPNPGTPHAGKGNGQGATPKPMSEWLQEAPGGGLGILVAIAIGVLGWIGFFLLRPDNTTVDQSRSMLAIIFSVGTITTAFCLMLGAFLSAGSETVKDRFTLANQVLTPLIGIMGTILGFYFGTAENKKSSEPLAIVDLMVAKDTVKPGESLPITAMVRGGQGPWEFSLTFANNALPAIRRKEASQNFRESIAIPAAQKGQLGVTLEVTDSLGATTKLERKVGEWVTIEAAAPETAPDPPQRRTTMPNLVPTGEPDPLPSAPAPQPVPVPQGAPIAPPSGPAT